MKTKYSAKIDEILEGEMDEATFQRWFLSQPLLDQPDILNEIQETIKQRLNAKDFDTLDIQSDIDTIKSIENTVLDHKLDTLLEALEIDLPEDEEMMSMNDAMSFRRELIDAILSTGGADKNVNNAAKEVIALEEKHNIYDPENWKEVLGLLLD